jgi:hypothetical protein
MSVEDDRIKALRFEGPSAIPVSASVLPAAWMKHRDELDKITRRHALLFGEAPEGGRDYDAAGGTYVVGEHVDAWGCVWTNLKTGRESIVTAHPVAPREAVRTLRAPEENAGLPHGFMWLRLADLRGFEQLMLDFAEEPPELQQLVDIVCDYNVRQAHRMLKDVSGWPIVGLGDDLGMQDRLAISPEKWRRYLKPCFTKIFRVFRDAGHDLYFHTDGHVLPIIADLIECGVSVLNAQVGANGIDGLAATCKGRLCVALDLDRQRFPFWTPGDIDAHILEAVETLGSAEGGLWLAAEIGDDVPLENVEAICASLEKHRFHFS